MKPITEKDNIHLEWYEQAAKIKTLDELQAFYVKLSTEYAHDYGTICHAHAAFAIAACWVMNASPQGGITGFQSGAIMWEFIRHWQGYKGPLRLINYDDLLYPQYEDRIRKIHPSTVKWLTEQAQLKLKENPDPSRVHPDVRKHWEVLAAGHVPFGLEVGE